MNSIKVISAPDKKNPFAVIYKPRNLPSAPLKEGDDSAFTQAAELFPEIKDVCGIKKIEGGLVHRIDNQTSGLLLIASTQEAYDSFQKQQKEDLFVKGYSSLCRLTSERLEGFSECIFSLENILRCIKNNTIFTLKSRFRPFGMNNSQVRPVTESSGKAALKKAGSVEYSTSVFLTETDVPDVYRSSCRITRGYRHQVRCHLSWAGFPVTGDSVYNPLYKEEDFTFCADYLKFIHPLTGTDVEITL